ncbi:hypothetical protein H1P_10046 [Hyella patelloides LEGE 07179]|uniref:Uncharacterized protein n=1 Tax=Hyella patelloides LEGE 07179 TaxID=945734 RepID=A0A563VIP7_9CYAN|nr:hypothetical protein H1P_10046 [Hyella patelloides LEGE 07179]
MPIKDQRFSFLLIFASLIPLILDLKIFISPSHTTQYETIAIAGL